MNPTTEREEEEKEVTDICHPLRIRRAVCRRRVDWSAVLGHFVRTSGANVCFSFVSVALFGGSLAVGRAQRGKLGGG